METTHTTYHESTYVPERVSTGTSYLEGLTGIAAIAIAIVGLAHVFSETLLAIATIAIGASLLFESGAIAARFAALISREEHSREVSAVPIVRGGGMTTGFMAGVAGIALGILALVNIAPEVLTAIAAVVYGSALVFDSGVYARLNNLETYNSGLRGLSREIAYESGLTASGIQVLVGLGAITLGILALVGIHPLVLSLVAMLSIGAALLLSETLMGSSLKGVFSSNQG